LRLSRRAWNHSRSANELRDAIPLAEDQVGADHQAAPLIALGKEGEEYLHFLTGLLHVAQIIDDDDFKAFQLFDFDGQPEAPLN
jgi:hypothetical protein